ncbi:TonB-dependent receptor [Psychrobium sp. nBUS_13]|uniref:TonB-dependent receptor n=1 Tax=Psychrobium sp. nBUS_13 TaxID=3395319 RepID=UPI003EBD804B
MNTINFTKSHLALCVSAVLLSGSYSQAFAADNDDKKKEKKAEVETIQVSGIRGGLIRSMDLRREEKGVVDLISAEDMGKFPDTNLAESLQRIPGVTISRANGEGSQITVRGFGPAFNLVTLNGRQMPGSGNTRSYNLENLSSDNVTTLEVHKSARATNPTGGLGATVNIVTTKPLDNPGQRYSVSAKAINDTSNVEGRDVTPEYSALYSNTFADEKFGVAFSYVHHRRDFQKQSANIQGWQANVALPTLDEENVIDRRAKDGEGNPIGPHFFPRDMNYGIENVARERVNSSLTLQFAPIDSVVISADYVRSDAKVATNSISWGMWNDYGGNINAYELDANGTAIFADMSGNDGSFTASRGTTEFEEESVGLNIAWQVNESLALSLDYHDSTSSADNGADKNLGSYGSLVLGSDQLRTKTYDYREGEVPQGIIYWNNGTTVLAPSEMDSHFSQFVHSPGESGVKQTQINGSWENSFDIPLVTVNFGAAHTKQTIGGSSSWSGLIGGFLFNPSYTELFPDSMFVHNNTDNFLNELAGGGSNLGSNYYYTFDFDEVVARSKAFLTNEQLGGDDYFDTSATHPVGTKSQGEVQETTTSLYIDSQWEFDVSDYAVSLNVGLRYEETDVVSSVLQPVPTQVWWKGGGEWLTQYLPGENNFLTQEGEHDVFLPMMDLKVDLNDEMDVRFSWGKSIARGPLGSLAGGRTLSGSPKIGSRNGVQGNTNLQPYESTNLDLVYSYYYAPGSYASVGYFNKKVKNFIGNRIVSTTIDGFHDIYQGPRWQQAESDIAARGEQVTNDAIFAQMQANGATLNEGGFITPNSEDPLIEWDISQPFNSSDEKEVQGIEVAVQHLFGESGFGLGVNATLVDGDVEFDVSSLEQQTPLEGLSDSANFQAFYEDDVWSVKVTYAWRDEFLLGVGQSQGSSDNPPQFAKAYAQWDLSANYNVTEELTVFAQGINLTNATEQHFGRYKEQFLQANQYGPRYVLGVRYSFK